MKNIRQYYLALLLTFILGIREGNIALWEAGQSEPVYVSPYRASTLPPAAREALERGIPIDRLEDLEELAENYLS